MRNFVLTSASVTDGHPDKLCDRISDAIVDAFLALDPGSHLNAECAIASGIVFLVVHSKTSAHVDLPSVVRQIVEETGYKDRDFNSANLTVLASEAPLASAGDRRGEPPVPESLSTTVFGYACRHTDTMLPLSSVLAHQMARRLGEMRRNGSLAGMHPDGQVQVAVRYSDRKPECIEGITIFSALDAESANSWQISQAISEQVIDPIVRSADVPLSNSARITVNPIDGVYLGGPTRHAGLTGRKNDIDTYGGYSRHGGAALSGKDPSRIDRTGAYAARQAAKTVVAAGLAEECEVQISYAMGWREPLSLEIDTFGSSQVPDGEIIKALRRTFYFGIDAMVDGMGLAQLPKARRGRFFTDLAVFGHFGRTELNLPWEQTDKAKSLAAGI
jgi:S-adenosylmethionine synthetase